MALKSTAELIEEVESAISKTLEALSVGMGDKSVYRNKLSDLYAVRKDLLQQYRAENNTGGPAFNTGIINRG